MVTEFVVPSCNSVSDFTRPQLLHEMGDSLATVDKGRKMGGCCAPFRGVWSRIPI